MRQMLLTIMGRAALESDVISYNAALSASKKGAEWQMTLAMIADMDQVILGPHTLSYDAAFGASKRAAMGCTIHQSNISSYNTVLSSCDENAQWRRAFALLAALGRAILEPSVCSYRAASNVCNMEGQWQMGLELLPAK